MRTCKVMLDLWDNMAPCGATSDDKVAILWDSVVLAILFSFKFAVDGSLGDTKQLSG